MGATELIQLNIKVNGVDELKSASSAMKAMGSAGSSVKGVGNIGIGAPNASAINAAVGQVKNLEQAKLGLAKAEIFLRQQQGATEQQRTKYNSTASEGMQIANKLKQQNVEVAKSLEQLHKAQLQSTQDNQQYARERAALIPLDNQRKQAQTTSTNALTAQRAAMTALINTQKEMLLAGRAVNASVGMGAAEQIKYQGAVKLTQVQTKQLASIMVQNKQATLDNVIAEKNLKIAQEEGVRVLSDYRAQQQATSRAAELVKEKQLQVQQATIQHKDALIEATGALATYRNQQEQTSAANQKLKEAMLQEKAVLVPLKAERLNMQIALMKERQEMMANKAASKELSEAYNQVGNSIKGLKTSIELAAQPVKIIVQLLGNFKGVAVGAFKAVELAVKVFIATVKLAATAVTFLARAVGATLNAALNLARASIMLTVKALELLITGLAKVAVAAGKAFATLITAPIRAAQSLLHLKKSADDTAKSVSDIGSKGTKNIEQVGNAADKSSNKLNLMKIAAAAMGGVTLAASVNAAAGFEQQMNILQSMFSEGDRTKKNLEDIRATAIQVGADTSFSAKEAATGMQAFAGAGLNVDEMLKAIGPAAKVAELNSISLADAADTGSIVMKAFGMSAQDLGHVFDVTTKAAQLGRMTFMDFKAAMGSVGSIAKFTGQSLEGTTAVIMALTDAGQSAQDAGTSFKSALMALANPSDPALAAIKQLGIHVRDNNGNYRQWADIVSDVEKNVNHLSKAQQEEALFQALGSDGVKAMTSALGYQITALKDGTVQVIKGSEALKFQTEALKNSDGEMAKSHELVRQGFIPAVDNMKGSLELLAMVIGNSMLPALTKMIQHKTESINKLVELENKWHVVGGTIGAVLTMIVRAEEIAGDSMRTFFGALKGGEKEWQDTGKAINGVSAAFGRLGLALHPMAVAFMDWVHSTRDQILSARSMNAAIIAMHTPIKIGTQLYDEFGNKIKEIHPITDAIGRAVKDGLVPAFNTVAPAIQKVVVAIASFNFKTFLINMGVTTEMMQNFETQLIGAGIAIFKFVALFNPLTFAITALVGAFRGGLHGALTAIEDRVVALGNVFGLHLKPSLDRLVASIEGGLRRAFEWLKTTIQQLVQHLQNMIKGIAPAIAQTTALGGGFLKVNQSASPLIKGLEILRNVLIGIAIVLASPILLIGFLGYKLVEAAQKAGVFKEVMDLLKKAGETVTKTFNDFTKSLGLNTSNVDKAFAGLANWLKTLIGNIGEFVAAAWDMAGAIVNVITKAFQGKGAVDVLNLMLKTITETVKGTAQFLKDNADAVATAFSIYTQIIGQFAGVALTAFSMLSKIGLASGSVLLALGPLIGVGMALNNVFKLLIATKLILLTKLEALVGAFAKLGMGFAGLIGMFGKGSLAVGGFLKMIGSAGGFVNAGSFALAALIGKVSWLVNGLLGAGGAVLGFGAKIGSLAGFAAKGGSALGGLLTNIKFVGPAFAAAGGIIASAGAGIAGVFVKLGGALSFLGPLLKGFESIMIAIAKPVAGLFGKLTLLGPAFEAIGAACAPVVAALGGIPVVIGIIVGVIALFVGGAFALATNLFGLTDTISDLTNTLGDVAAPVRYIIGEFLKLGQEVIKSVGTAFSFVWDNVQKFITPIAQNVLPALGAAFGAVVYAVVEITRFIWGLAEVIGSFLGPIIRYVADTFSGALAGALTVITGLIAGLVAGLGWLIGALTDYVIPVLKALAALLAGGITGAVELVITAFKSLGSIVSGIIQAIMKAVTGDFAGAWEEVKKGFGGAGDAIAEARKKFEDSANDVRDAMSDFGKAGKNPLDDFGKKVEKTGQVIRGVIGPMRDWGYEATFEAGRIAILTGEINRLNDASQKSSQAMNEASAKLSVYDKIAEKMTPTTQNLWNEWKNYNAKVLEGGPAMAKWQDAADGVRQKLEAQSGTMSDQDKKVFDLMVAYGNMSKRLKDATQAFEDNEVSIGINTGGLGKFKDAADDTNKNALQPLWKTLATTGKTATDAFATQIATVGPKAQASMGALQPAFQSAVPAAQAGGAATGNGLASGIEQGIIAAKIRVIVAAIQMVTEAVAAAKAAGAIHSPSKKTEEEIGKPLTEGIAVGIIGQAGLVADAMKQIGDVIGKAGLEEAAKQADDIAKIADSASKMAGAITAIRTAGGVGADEIARFVQTTNTIVADLAGGAHGFNEGSLKAVGDYSDAMSKVADGGSKMADFIGKLAETGTVSQGKIEEFNGSVVTMVNAFVAGAGVFSTKALTAAATFTEAAGKMADAGSTVMDFLNEVRNYSIVDVGHIEMLNANTMQMVNAFAAAADQFSSGMVVGAADYAESAGKVAESAAKALDLLNQIREYSDVGLGHIEVFNANVMELVNAFAAASEYFDGGMLAHTAAYSETAGKVLDAAGKAFDVMKQLAGYAQVGLGFIEMFNADVMRLVSAFASAAIQFSEKALIATGAYAETAGKVVDSVGGALEAFKSLQNYKGPAAAAVDAFLADLLNLMTRFAAGAGTFKTEALDAASKYGEAAKSAIEVVGSGVENFSKLGDYQAVSQDRLGQFVADMVTTVRMFVASSGEFKTEALDAAKNFSEAAKSAVETIGSAAEAFVKLQEYSGIPNAVLQGFVSDIRLAIVLAAAAAQGMESEMLQKVALFGEATGKIFDGLKSAIDVFKGLEEYKSTPSKVIQDFVYEIELTVALASQMAARADTELVAQARKFADACKDIFDGLKSAMELFKDLADFKSYPADGIKKLIEAIEEAIKRMAVAAERSQSFKDLAYRFRDNIKDGARAIMDAAADAARAAAAAAAAAQNASQGTEPGKASGGYIRGRASGGPAGGGVLVGENGPEVFYPGGQDGYVVNNPTARMKGLLPGSERREGDTYVTIEATIVVNESDDPKKTAKEVKAELKTLARKAKGRGSMGGF